MSAEGSSEAKPVWGHEMVVEVAVFLGVYAGFFLVALYRSAALFHASRRLRHRFLAKKIFFVLLTTYMLLRVVDSTFELASPCWVAPGGYKPYCMAVDAVFKRVAGMLLVCCFFTMCAFWADFVSAFLSARNKAHSGVSSSETAQNAVVFSSSSSSSAINSGNGSLSNYGTNNLLARLRVPMVVAGGVAAAAIVSYVVLVAWLRSEVDTLLTVDTVFMFIVSIVTCVIALGVAWFGIRITLLARSYNPGSWLHVKILVLALLCAALLCFKAIWWMAVTNEDQSRGRPIWREVLSTLISEIIPVICMMVIFWPIPRPPESFPLRRS